jgi:hypothetical protein
LEIRLQNEVKEGPVNPLIDHFEVLEGTGKNEIEGVAKNNNANTVNLNSIQAL